MTKRNQKDTREHADETRMKILCAAKELFVKHGYAGTSMGKIASLAGVNHSLIFHHYGNKQQLWVAVKVAIYEKANAQSPVIPDLNLPLQVFLEKLMRQMMNFYHASPDTVRMINWQRLESSKERGLGLGYSSVSKQWIKAFVHYQQKGEIDSSMKPEFILSYVISIISTAALDHNFFIKELEEKEAYIAFCAQAMARGLCCCQE